MTIQNSKLNTFHSYAVLAVLFLLPIYLIRIKIGRISFNLVELLIAALLIFWFFNREKKYSILNTQYLIPIFLIFVGLVLSIIANQNYYSGFGVVKGWFIFPLIFAVVFYDRLKKDNGFLHKALSALFFSGMAISLIGIFYKLLGILTYDNRLRIFWDSPNQLAMFLAIPLLIGFSRFNLKNYYQLLGAILIGANLYFTKSYGAWLALVIAIFIVLWLKHKDKLQKKYLFVMILILIILIGAIGFGKFEQIKNLGDRSSLASRAIIWQSAGLMIQNNSLFGIGPGNFQEKYLEYQKYFPPYLEWAVPQPHNLYLAFWLESGLLGLVGFVWIILLFFRDNKKARKNNSESGLVCLAIILYFLLHGLIDTTYWRNDIAMVFWVVVTMNIFLADKSN